MTAQIVSLTAADRLLKAAHMAIEADRELLNALRLPLTRQVTIRLKPRGDAIRVSITVDNVEREV